MSSIDPSIIAALAIQADSSPHRHVIDITTIGARSGQPRRIEIWFHRVDGHFYISGMPTARNWYANLRKNPDFVFHLKGEVHADLPARALPVDDETRRRVIPAIVGQQDLPEYAARGVPHQNVDVWLARSPLVEVRFDDDKLQAAASVA